MPRWTIRRVTPTELRRIFNEGRYYERAEAGELAQQVGYNRHPCPPQVREPYCTRSQTVHYIDLELGGRVAMVHQYLRMNGELGASGRPDPKRVLEGGTLYIAELPEPY